ncbi:hypothetical protein ACSBR1_012653 [Camellia fascicularis]
MVLLPSSPGASWKVLVPYILSVANSPSTSWKHCEREAVEQQLSYLNEPSVLHNLQYRYCHDIIYSKAGPVLIAIKPFKDVHCFGNVFITAYREKLFDNPHVFAIPDTAYNEMMRGGAGKTETAKIAMQYLAALGGGSGGVESEILQTSCILEAFGNPSIIMDIKSGSAHSRRKVIYHIFYQLCAGAPSGLKDIGRVRVWLLRNACP